MCKCEKRKVEVVKASDITGVIGELLDVIFGEEPREKVGTNIDLDEEIDNVVFNNPATIVFWKDGTKTVTKCQNGDEFNKETGLAMCIVRKLCNNKNYNKVFKKYC